MIKITLHAEEVRGCRWDLFTKAYHRLNTATPEEIYIDTLDAALKKAGVNGPGDLKKLLSYTDGKKYLCICFEMTDKGQLITFEGSDAVHKIQEPSAS